MRRTQQAAPGFVGPGTTRWIDVSLDLTPGAQGGGFAIANTIRHNRSGLTVNGVLTINSASWNLRNGKLCYYIPAGLSYGVLWGLGFPVNVVQPLTALAQLLRQGVTRFCTSLQFDGGPPAPNSDVGVECIVAYSAATGFTDLTTVTAVVGGGKQGWAVLYQGGVWNFVIKLSGSAVGAWAEVVPLAWPAPTNLFVDVEFRIYDATFAEQAKMELWLSGVKVLTRYWVNPPGVVTQTLPPFGDAVGYQLFLLQRNCSTGPIALHFADTEIVAGPNDAGTL